MYVRVSVTSSSVKLFSFAPAVVSLVGHVEFLTSLLKLHLGMDALYKIPEGAKEEFAKYEVPPDIVAGLQQQREERKLKNANILIQKDAEPK